MTKVWKSERILMRFLDSPPWANRSKGLEFTGILLISFININNKWANCSYLNDIEWQKSENPKILMRFLDSPPWADRSKGLEFTSILLISFFFVRKHRQQMTELVLFVKWGIFFFWNKISWMTKVWKSERIWMRFLDSPPWADRSKGLEFTGILLTPFFFVRKHKFS